jgi:hypothetical protein
MTILAAESLEHITQAVYSYQFAEKCVVPLQSGAT